MTHIEQGKVDIGIDDTPLLNTMFELNPKATERAVIIGDMSVLFVSLITEYGTANTAEYIETSLKNAIEIVKKEGENKNAKSSN